MSNTETDKIRKYCTEHMKSKIKVTVSVQRLYEIMTD